MLSLYHFKFGVSYCQCCSITIVINTMTAVYCLMIQYLSLNFLIYSIVVY